MPETLAQATAAAEATQAEYLRIQQAALEAEPDKRPAGAEVVAAAQEAELAGQRVEVARRREEQARETARQQACAVLAKKVSKFCADAAQSTTLAVLAANVAGAVAALQAGVAAHNTAVAGFQQQVKALGVQRGRDGPRAIDGHLSAGKNGIRYRDISVSAVTDRALSYAITYAVKGDVAAAEHEVAVTNDHTPAAPSYWVRDTVGQFPPEPVYERGPSRALAEGIREGRFVRMTAQEVAQWGASSQ